MKYVAIFRIELRQLTVYTWDFILSNITIVVFFFILLQVWEVTITPEAAAALPGEDFTWDQLIWFFAGGQVLYYSVRTETQLDIEEDVISGNIAVTLARPYDYLMARFASTMAYTFISFCVAFIAGGIAAWIASGTVAISLFGLVAFIIAFVLRSLLFFAVQSVAGISTFWIEKATAFVWVIGLLIYIFGGGAVPLGYWPEWAQELVSWTPFPVMMYYPVKLLVAPSFDLLLDTLVRGVVWLCVMGGIVGLMYRAAIRRLDINGG